MKLSDLILLAKCYHYKFTPKRTSDLCYGYYQNQYLKRDRTYDLYINDDGRKFVVVRTNKINSVEVLHTSFLNMDDTEQVREPLICGEFVDIFNSIKRELDSLGDRISDMNRNNY